VSAESDGRYEFDRTVRVAASREAVLDALVTPDLMAQWMVGVESVSEVKASGSEVGTRLELVTRLGSRYGDTAWLFQGEVTARDVSGLVRVYHLAQTRAGAVPTGNELSEYERTVRYALEPHGAGTVVGCSVTTVIPGLARSAARMGGRSEARSLEFSLRQLQRLVEGTTGSRVAHWLRASGLSPQPL
jgi:uncharacterized protein YndB with AHSA1/START domain